VTDAFLFADLRLINGRLTPYRGDCCDPYQDTAVPDIRWSSDYPAQQVRLVARTTDTETGEELVVVRKSRCPRFCYTADEWSRLERVVICDRSGAS